MKILLVGDIVGKKGRQVIRELIPQIKQDYKIDFCIANGENAAGGFGLTQKTADEIFNGGVDVITSGNHIWNKKEVFQIIENEHILRPLNYPPGVPGRGYNIYNVQDNLLAVINLAGRVFVDELDCPFRTVLPEIIKIREKTLNIVIDMHAETTSEKVAMGWYLDGQVSAVIGTHTHVQTADERILPQGTAYISDMGMTGPRDSVIGVKTEIILKRFLTQIPLRFDVAKGVGQLGGVVVEIDTSTGKAKSIIRVQKFLEKKGSEDA
ncbi:MAG: TIGR00282 family metallophosphoesterase [bacterium]|nr:TIGR00282 family metallophosphoesterase [bacterium]